MRLRPALALCITLGMVALPLMLPPAGAITYTLRENSGNTSSGCVYVSLGQRIAQSFTATANYSLARVTLYVDDRGADDWMTVSLVREVGGFPSDSLPNLLARASNNTPAVAGWYDFDLAPHVFLTQGQRYWILANSSAASNPNSYCWYGQNPGTYGGGFMAFNDTTNWFSSAWDVAFRNYGYDNAHVSVAIRADRSVAPIGSSVQYRIYFNNTGLVTASDVWVNVTLPSNLTYGSDSAASVGGTTLGPSQWYFRNVTVGAHSFLLNATVAGGAGGQLLTTVATVRFVGALGTVEDGGTASVNVVTVGPNLQVTLRATPPQVRRGSSPVLSGYLNNTGNDITGVAWLNFTLPSSASYRSDDLNATLSVVNRTWGPGRLNVTLVNLSLGAHGFTLMLDPVGDPPVGTTFPVAMAVEYRNPLGVAFPKSTATAQPVLVGPQITLSSTYGGAFATPGDRLVGRVDFANGGPYSTAASALWINVTVSSPAALLNSSAGSTWDATNRTLRWPLGSLGVGASGSLWYNASLPWPVADLTPLDLRAAADFIDDIGNPMARIFANRTIPVHVPVLGLASSISAAAVEVGTPVTHTVAFNNTGSGVARRVWIDLALDQGLSFQGFALQGTAASLLSFQTSGGVLYFLLADVAPGPHTLVLTLQPAGRLTQGAQLSMTATLSYSDGNGNIGAPSVAPAQRITIQAPSLTASLGVSATSLLPGQRVRLFLTVQNLGGAAAREYWANLTLDQSLVAVGGDAPVVPEVLGPRYSYHLSNLAQGATLTFFVEMAVAANATAGRSMLITMTVEYHDAAGTPQPSVRPAGVPLTILQGPAPRTDPLSYAFPAALAAMVGLALFLVVRYVREPDVEEVLLVHKEGLLMGQALRGEARGKDRDILASSLVAVKDFIREAFLEETSKDLDRMDLGDYKLLIQKGKGAFLVVALQGSPTRRTLARVRETLGAIEGVLGPVLEDWNGDTDLVTPAIPYLEQLVHRGRPHSTPPPSSIPPSTPRPP